MGSLTVHVLDGVGNPVGRKEVRCIFTGIIGTNSYDYTDKDGIVEFAEVPVCTLEVYVDGKLRVKVGVGAGKHEDVTVTL